MGILPVYMSIYRVCVVPVEARRGRGSSGSGVIDGCELSSECWELNLDPQEM